MAKRKTRRGNPKYNWPAILAAAVLVSAFLIIYLATGNKISDLFPRLGRSGFDGGKLDGAVFQD